MTLSFRSSSSHARTRPLASCCATPPPHWDWISRRRCRPQRLHRRRCRPKRLPTRQDPRNAERGRRRQRRRFTGEKLAAGALPCRCAVAREPSYAASRALPSPRAIAHERAACRAPSPLPLRVDPDWIRRVGGGD